LPPNPEELQSSSSSSSNTTKNPELFEQIPNLSSRHNSNRSKSNNTHTFIFKTKSQICHIPNQIGPNLTLSVKPRKSREHVESLCCKNHKNTLGRETGRFNPYSVSMADPISKPLIAFLLIASFLLCSHASSDL